MFRELKINFHDDKKNSILMRGPLPLKCSK